MNLQERKELLVRLGNYMLHNNEEWQNIKEKAFAENRWFIPEFIDLSIKNIADNFLQPSQLQQLIDKYQIPAENKVPKKVGIVMAGNIPLVGFHDLLCVFITGHFALIKPSAKDEVIVKHLALKMMEWQQPAEPYFTISDMIKHAGAYIATGSNNSARYFEYYFQKYPNIIRKNRTSVAILSGNETKEQLENLADDVYQYFGLGCRNVTKVFVPENYDFIPLLNAFKKYDYLSDHNKYKNNYDYNLAMHILNNTYYMTNGTILLVENESIFSRISHLHYQYYKNEDQLQKGLKQNENIQCIVSKDNINFGKAQCPGLYDYADGVDTIHFLKDLN